MDRPGYVAMNVLRMGGVRPSWLGEARVELVPTPESRWLAHRRGAHKSVEITKPSFSFTTKRGYHVVELGNSYSVAGSQHSGRYRREFPTEHEAEEFVRDLMHQPCSLVPSPFPRC